MDGQHESITIFKFFSHNEYNLNKSDEEDEDIKEEVNNSILYSSESNNYNARIYKDLFWSYLTPESQLALAENNLFPFNTKTENEPFTNADTINKQTNHPQFLVLKPSNLINNNDIPKQEKRKEKNEITSKEHSSIINNNFIPPKDITKKKTLFKVIKNETIKRKLPRLYRKDNITKKFKNHYTNFTIDLLNEIIKERLGQSDKYFFYYLDYKYKKNTKKENMELFKNQTIEQVIKNNISKKYKTKDSNFNEKMCEKIKKDEKLKDIAGILDKKFTSFFDIYEEKNKEQKYNLKNLGLIDLEIDLSKLKLYEDLKNKNQNQKYYTEYIEKMDNYKNNILNKKHLNESQ